MEVTVEQLKQNQRMYSWVRKIYPTLTDADKEEARQIFPEVLESEDERIRNDIMDAVENWLPYERVEEIRGYLRRQKEQKPAEWSEEDKRKLNRIYEILGYAADDKGFLTSKRIIGDKEAIELQDFLKSLPERFNLPPKQEWSEDDEDKVDDICKLIEHATIIPRSGDDDTGIPPTRLNDKYKGELKAFVKSFRNRPTKSDTWKPSEEQMEVFVDSIYFLGQKGFKDPNGMIESLYQDLKKL